MKDWLTISNLISIGRFFMSFFVAAEIIKGNFLLAITLFGVAAVTDALDGYLARKLNQMTKLGQILDPIADKSLVLMALLAIAINNAMLLWFLLIVVAYDLFLAFYIWTVAKRGRRVYPTYTGKVKMVVVFVTVFLLLLKPTGAICILSGLMVGFSIIMMGLAFASYIITFSREGS